LGALDALRALDPLWAPLTLLAGVPFFALRADRALDTGVALRSLRAGGAGLPLRPLRAGRAGLSLPAHLALRADLTLRALFALRTGGPCGTLRTRLTGRTLRALRPHRALFARRALHRADAHPARVGPDKDLVFLNAADRPGVPRRPGRV